MKIDYTRYYLKWHSDTPEHQADTTTFYKRILGEHLPEDRTAKILDVGCGMGFALWTLHELGYSSISGVDCDVGQVASCQRKGLNVALVEDTVDFLSARPFTFHTILALDVIEHVPVNQQLAFVHAIATALLPEGKLICTVPNANSAIAERWRYNDWTHHSSFTEHSLDFLLYNGGLDEIVISEVEALVRPRYWWLPVSGGRHWWAFRFFRLWRRLEMMAELGPQQGRAVPLTLNLLAVAKKKLIASPEK